MKNNQFLLLLLCLVFISQTILSQSPNGNLSQRFTRADTLRGMLTPERSCYDVTYYHLDIRVDPEKRFISGSNKIRFRAVNPFKKMQIDLYDNMEIESVAFKSQKSLLFAREYNAVFIELPETVAKGSEAEITIHYSGNPRVSLRPPWHGGFTWASDSSGNPWVAVTCQGDGASLWWPNKDHQSDEPDSMMLSVTVPPGLQNISNGRLRNKETLDDGWERYNWFISYPINNYNVTLNIGKFAHFSDVYTNADNETLTLDYYVLPASLEKAKKQFQQVKPMMECLEKYFGKYPFYRDGFKLIESPHNGMEHQTAVAYGNRFLGGYLGKAPAAVGLEFDFIILHETAHEWWGNSVTSNDIADMWIHESFGAYTEAVYVEHFYGYDEALKYINGKKQTVGNAQPIIGVYNVHKRGAGDMYNKGQLVLNTLRNVIDNDSLWFSILLGIQDTFKYQSIDAVDVFNYINQKTGQDFGYFFEQYLKHPEIPELAIFLRKSGKRVSMQYKWNADVTDFRMPVKVTTSKSQFEFIYPTTEDQTMELNEMALEDFQIAEDLFYVNLNLRWQYLDPELNN